MCKFETLHISSFNLNFRYTATSRHALHTHASCNAVPLVWGSLRLAPIKSLPLWVISQRNLTSFTRRFLAGRCAWAGHKANFEWQPWQLLKTYNYWNIKPYCTQNRTIWTCHSYCRSVGTTTQIRVFVKTKGKGQGQIFVVAKVQKQFLPVY